MARKLVVEIVGDASSLEREFKRSAQGAKRFERQIGQIGRGTVAGAFQGMGRQIAFASAGFLSAAGAVSAFRSAFSELAESQRVSAQTNAVIRSTGSVAGVTADQVDALATALLRKSGIDDEVIKSGENVLLTFTNIRNEAGKGNDVFNQATKAALDMSVAMGEDLQGAIVRVGKALQDPVKGATALRRVGVQLTDQQQKQIKAFVAQNRLLDAQRVIVGELNREFGGSAAALGQTPLGKLNRLRETFRNFTAEVLGGAQDGGALSSFADRLTLWLQDTKNVERAQKDLNTTLETTAAILTPLAHSIEGLGIAFGGIARAASVLPNLPFLKTLLPGQRDRPGILGPIGKPPDPNAPPFVPPGLVGPVGMTAPGGGGRVGVSAGQRNQWFDSMISRRLNRVQDVRTLRAQVAALTQIAALVRERLAKTKDVTRRMTLEDELVDVMRQRSGLNAQILSNRNERERLRLLTEAEQLAAKRARSLERLRNAQASARAAFGELGQGPVMQGPMMDMLRQWGGKARAADFIADLRRQVTDFATLQRDLGTLKKRGLSAFAIQTLRAQGQGGAEEAHALATAKGSELQTFNRYIGQRRDLIRKASMQVQTPRVTVHATAVHVHGSQKKSSQADNRVGARPAGHI